MRDGCTCRLFSKDGKLVLKAGDSTAKTTTSSYEVALAGRGFNQDIEAAYGVEKGASYFKWVDRMESFGRQPVEIAEFLNQGGINPPGGSQ